ncbi:hypothetical protein ERJ75_001653100 [Trypanosoma vivax]|uniref:Uncharacterized protein n=1 Tax=Trypanosoma vivax (strain Y486) TaxID=1055687 RepID=G0U9I0_TRYVY|nr:hypothetical protein ERJ75_001653100 [Trypanosoma vivax]CCC54266.1 conserved hypothetical protein [Trypanosoma vivax Y486]
MLRAPRSYALRLHRGRRAPRAIAAMPTAPLRHSWGDIGRMSVAEREQLLEGPWTRVRPVHLIPDPQDRDAGGFVDGVRFASDAEAEAFLAEEAMDDEAESKIPTMQLARQFFEELAHAADSEVDVENVLEAPGASDQERAEEERDVHRHFFADYYIQQGLIRDDEKFLFVDAMLRPPGVMLIVNAGLPFIRLIVRWQLIEHAHSAEDGRRGVVFCPHSAHPLLFTVDVVPTQPYGMKARLPYTEKNSVLAQREAQTLLADPSTSNTEENTILQEGFMNALNQEGVGAAGEDAVVKGREDDICGSVQASVPGGCLSSVTACDRTDKAPLSIGHFYWLQRQVASDSLIDMDPLGLLVPLILGVTSCSGGIVLDMSGRSRGVDEQCYGEDIASHLAMWYGGLGKSEGVGDAQLGSYVQNVAVVSLLSLERTDRESKKKHGNVVLGVKASREEIPEEYEADSDVLRKHKCCQAGTVNRITVRVPSSSVWDPLRGKCDYVFCCPRTTADGCKPRSALSVGREEDEAAANRFASICSKVNRLFPYLRRELSQALEYACSEGGRVVYATHSMNPLENEAVVCSVLTDLARKHPGRIYRPVSLLEGYNRNDEIDVGAVIATLTAEGQSGLASWVPIQDGQAEQELAYCDKSIVEQVARCSWRSSPIKAVGDVCFICVIEVGEKCYQAPTEAVTTATATDVACYHEVNACASFAFTWCDHDKLRNQWGLLAFKSEGNGILSIITMSVRRVLDVIHTVKPSTTCFGAVGLGVHLEDARVALSLQGRQRQEQQQRKDGDAILLCSSLSGTLLAFALCSCVRETHRATHVLELPFGLILELLRTRKISSKRLHTFQRKTTLSDLPDAVSFAGAGQNVFLTVTPPEPFSSDIANVELHEVVVSELRKLVIVATAPFNNSVAAQDSSTALMLTCGSTHAENILEERIVAITDALCYLLRKLGYPESLWHQPPLKADEGCVLREDEYELEADAGARAINDNSPFVSPRAEWQHQRRLARLSGKLRSLGVCPEGEAVNDWEKDLRYRRRAKHPSRQQLR